jgi:DNA repair exonuclease SbcCD ATPase subunit
MRIALAMVIVPNLRWLILDEPTHNIDENGINKFIDVLSNSLPKVVEQIFIITHDNALKNITGARVYQLDRDKDRSEYTSVAEL